MPVVDSYMTQLQGYGSIYVGALAMGFFYGLTLCSFSCLPLIGPYVFGTRTDFRQGFDATAIFMLARIAGYTALGALSGLVGSLLLQRVGLKAPLVVGGILVLVISVLVLRRRRGCRTGSALRTFSNSHVAVLGVATSLMPCPPLYAVMVYAATTQSAMTGALLAFCFALGTASSPLYYLGGAAGWLSGRIGQETGHRHHDLLRILSGLIIAMFGTKLILTGLL